MLRRSVSSRWAWFHVMFLMMISRRIQYQMILCDDRASLAPERRVSRVPNPCRLWVPVKPEPVILSVYLSLIGKAVSSLRHSGILPPLHSEGAAGRRLEPDQFYLRFASKVLKHSTHCFVQYLVWNHCLPNTIRWTLKSCWLKPSPLCEVGESLRCKNGEEA